MTLTFTHRGVIRTLAKHPNIRQALKRGELTEAEARGKAWFLRCKIGERERTFKLPAEDKAAIRAAKDLLNGRQDKPELFSQFLATLEARRGVTLGVLAADWLTLGLPDDSGRERESAAAERLKTFTTSALRWWKDCRAHAVDRKAMNEFSVWRRANTPRGQGDRSTDLELAALSCLCQWAVAVQRLEKNPFASRDRYRRSDDVEHCHEAMPANDEQFHRLLEWFFTSKTSCNFTRAVAGGWLAFCALSGLRPGEPAFLQRVPRAPAFPPDLNAAPHGLIYPLPDGSWRMKVARLKHGQNPSIILHSALTDFLSAWTVWLEANTIDSRLFPLRQEQLSDFLDRACAECGVPHLKPHGFGRAYYVRVRRSQGADDATIALELGQSTNGDLIRSVYGDPRDPVGGNLHDWLPAGGVPAWELLKPASERTSNIVRL